MSRGRCNGNRLRRDAVRGASVLQRARRSHRGCDGGRRQRHDGCAERRRPIAKIRVLQTDVAAGRADAVAGVRQRHRTVRVPRHVIQRLRRVVPEAGEMVRGGPVEVRERHVRRPRVRRLRHRHVAVQQHER